MAKLPEQYLHTWKGMAGPGDPLGVPWWVMVVGIGLCASPAYWCTDFLLVQRALAAKDLASSRKTPLVAAIPKMLFPAIVTVQGMLALAIAPSIIKQDYNLALPTLMGRYYHRVRALPAGRAEVYFSHGVEYLDGRVGTRCRTGGDCGSQLPD